MNTMDRLFEKENLFSTTFEVKLNKQHLKLLEEGNVIDTEECTYYFMPFIFQKIKTPHNPNDIKEEETYIVHIRPSSVYSEHMKGYVKTVLDHMKEDLEEHQDCY